ncbi:YceI family protein [Chitinophaga sp. sic0106]|uniref:YceI family protein n=1 Tax=Chitinophaga sp. sic0106 TaxID=2854785 RepID=UPI001C443189|nr:YceI family protein [Chitinophaga sp. sic0106]MBV7531694.1 YceI family protein [Chitinophaga sp. sic0106]
MKYVLLLAFGLLLHQTGFCQDIFTAKGATISFFSSAPLEDIEAKTSKAVSAINIKTKAIYFKVPIASFDFEERLMQQHFNSTYLESDKYPDAEFKGNIQEEVDLSVAGTYNVTVAGTLTLHGVDKPYREKGTITVSGNTLQLNAKFNVKLADHKIKIPTIVVKNIAEQVAVTVNATYAVMAK